VKRLKGFFLGKKLLALGIAGAREGFRSVKWNTHINEVDGMEYWASENGLQYYTRGGEQLNLGGVKADVILYGFRKNRLKSFKIITVGEKNYGILKKAFSRRFGPGEQFPDNNGYNKKHAWAGYAAGVFLEMEKSPSSSFYGSPLRPVVTLTVFKRNCMFENANKNRRISLTQN
jgi:hypothetical protein